MNERERMADRLDEHAVRYGNDYGYSVGGDLKRAAEMLRAPATEGEGDIVKRLREACDGHPYAKVEWPHRIFHEASDEIERLRKALQEIVDAISPSRADDLGAIRKLAKTRLDAIA